MRDGSLGGKELKTRTIGNGNLATGSVDDRVLTAKVAKVINAGVENTATGSIKLDGAANVTLDTVRSINNMGDAFKAGDAARTGNGTYVVTIDGLSKYGARLNAFVSLSVLANNAYFATARIDGSTLIVQTYTTTGNPSDLPANSFVAFLLNGVIPDAS